MTGSGTAVTRLWSHAASCPHCNANLIQSEIPQADRHNYLPMVKDETTGRFVDGSDDGRKLYFYRIIGMSSMLFDRVLAWSCPDCKVTDVIPGMEAKWAEEQAYWAERGAAAARRMQDATNKAIDRASAA
jgi:hypothetical protein